MTANLLQQQASLPELIDLHRHHPRRREFDLKRFDPARVSKPGDLPPYLLLGPLVEDSVDIGTDAWQAVYQGVEPDTRVTLSWAARTGYLRLETVWRGETGPVSVVDTARAGLAACASMACRTFPARWDVAAKRHFEHSWQVHYQETPPDDPGFTGVPDGWFRTLVLPTHVQDLRPAAVGLQMWAFNQPTPYPWVAQARRLTQSVRYVPGRAPEWVMIQPALFLHSVGETGLAPLGMPAPMTSQAGDVMTMFRQIYVVEITVPFAGLWDLVQNHGRSGGPIRSLDDPPVAFPFQPLLLPARERHTVRRWDADRAIYCGLEWKGVPGDGDGAIGCQIGLGKLDAVHNQVTAGLRAALEGAL